MAEYLLKVVLVGNSRVGKTSLLTRYVDDKFTENHISTIGVDFRMKTLIREGGIAKMQLWDTAGQERFRNIVSLFYRGADGLVLVFDVTDADSFKRIPSWLNESNAQCQEECVRVLVGNKTDMSNRVVDTQTAQEFADKYGIQYIETSAKTASNVQDMFDSMADAILKTKKELEHLPSLGNTGELCVVGQSTEVVEDSWCWGRGTCSLG